MGNAEKSRIRAVKSGYSNDIIRFISEARKTLDAYGDEESPTLLVGTPEYLSALSFAKERGVRLRYIASITSENLRFCKGLMRIAELRHLEGIKGVCAVSENDCIITVRLRSTPSDRNRVEPVYHTIQSEEREILQHQQFTFDKLWSNAIPAVQRIKTIETGIEPNFMEILHNRERAENLILSQVKDARSELLIALNSSRYLGHLASIGIIDRIEQAKSAGASILVLCPNLSPIDVGIGADDPMSRDYDDTTRVLSDIQRYAEIRSLAGGLTGTIIVIDNKQVIAMSEEGIEAVTLHSNDKSIVNNFASLFGALWTEKELFRNLVRTRDQLASANLKLVEANEQLKNNEKLQKEFINIAAHELRTPVQPILGMAELLQSRLGDADGDASLSRDDVELIVRNAKRLERLASDLLEVSRMESNSFRLNEPLTIDLNERITQAASDMRRSISSKADLKLSVVASHEPIQVDVDASRFSEVLFNLIGNAIKFTEHGEITIAVEKQNREAVVRVSDTGRGIDLDVMPKLFTKFTPKSQSGTGLGLFISKNIIEAHGGNIWAENNKNGKGATITFTLPISVQLKEEQI